MYFGRPAARRAKITGGAVASLNLRILPTGRTWLIGRQKGLPRGPRAGQAGSVRNALEDDHARLLGGHGQVHRARGAIGRQCSTGWAGCW